MISVLPDYSLKNYITSYSIEENRQSHALWRRYTSRPGLIDLKNYSYDVNSFSYVDLRTGRHIPNRQITIDAVRFSQGMRDEQRALTTRAINGQITQQEWYEENLRLMKLSYSASIDVASGQQKEDNSSEAILLLLLLFFIRFNRLAQSIDSGETLLNKSVLGRVGLYGLNNKSVFENKRLQVAKREGFSECRRIPGPSEHCQDGERPGCDELIQKGWMPISEMVPLGETTCLSNCQCSLEFRNRVPSVLSSINLFHRNNSGFMRVENKAGKLLFMFNPENMQIEIKHKWQDAPVVIDLTKYRR